MCPPSECSVPQYGVCCSLQLPPPTRTGFCGEAASVLSPDSWPAGNLRVLALWLNTIVPGWLVKTALGFVLVSAVCRVGM